jgi:hypothetical protein
MPLAASDSGGGVARLGRLVAGLWLGMQLMVNWRKLAVPLSIYSLAGWLGSF